MNKQQIINFIGLTSKLKSVASFVLSGAALAILKYYYGIDPLVAVGLFITSIFAFALAWTYWEYNKVNLFIVWLIVGIVPHMCAIYIGIRADQEVDKFKLGFHGPAVMQFVAINPDGGQQTTMIKLGIIISNPNDFDVEVRLARHSASVAGIASEDDDDNLSKVLPRKTVDHIFLSDSVVIDDFTKVIANPTAKMDMKICYGINGKLSKGILVKGAALLIQDGKGKFFDVKLLEPYKAVSCSSDDD